MLSNREKPPAAGWQWPRLAWSRLLGVIARSDNALLRTALVRGFMRLYDVSLDDCERRDVRDYRSFNDFFTRRLQAGARPVDADPQAIVSPCDGVVSAVGRIDQQRLLQAKGIDYSVQDLVGDAALADALTDGFYMTVYLSPRDYHRVHAPMRLPFRRLRRTGFARFAVNERSTASVDGLYVVNERAIFDFSSEQHACAIIMVGAVGVGSIQTVFDADSLDEPPNTVSRGDEIGRFNLGSTVILLVDAKTLTWRDDIDIGTPLKLGERIATPLRD